MRPPTHDTPPSHAYRWTRKDGCPRCLSRNNFPHHISERPGYWFLALYTCPDCAHTWGTSWADEESA